MKKFLTLICTALLVAVFALTLAGCDKSGSIKSAYEKAGYEVKMVKVEDNDDLKDLLKNHEEEDLGKYGGMLCTKNFVTATVLIFPSEEKIQEILGDTVYNSAQTAGRIKGNCYLLPTISSDALNVFKNA